VSEWESDETWDGVTNNEQFWFHTAVHRAMASTSVWHQSAWSVISASLGGAVFQIRPGTLKRGPEYARRDPDVGMMSTVRRSACRDSISTPWETGFTGTNGIVEQFLSK
jgi:hypothetical protein